MAAVETRCARRRRLKKERLKRDRQDRICDLPDDILHSILQFLPIKSAAQTVVLSRRWRDVFSSLPDLDFTPRDEAVIEHVLSHRDNNSSIRTLKLASCFSSTILNCLTECARTINIHGLNANVSSVEFRYVNFPWDLLVSCGFLKVLRLDSVRLDVKPTHRFKSLHTLTLSNIITDSLHEFTDSMFPSLKKLKLKSSRTVKLYFNCRGLKDLVIKRCYTLQQLDVHGVELERLKVDSCFTDRDTEYKTKIIAPVIKSLKWVGNYIMHIPLLEHTSSLEWAVIGFLHEYENHIITPYQQSCLSKMMIALSHVKTLKFHYPFTEILKAHYFKDSFVTKFESLTQLEISTSMNFQGFATLFKSCPYLHTLVITIFYAYGLYWNEGHQQLESGGENFWEDQIPELISFLNHLKIVRFNAFDKDDDELCTLAKFFLQHGKVLENIILYLMDLYMTTLTPSERIKSVMDLSWVSPKVKVFC